MEIKLKTTTEKLQWNTVKVLTFIKAKKLKSYDDLLGQMIIWIYGDVFITHFNLCQEYILPFSAHIMGRKSKIKETVMEYYKDCVFLFQNFIEY